MKDEQNKGKTLVDNICNIKKIESWILNQEMKYV